MKYRIFKQFVRLESIGPYNEVFSDIVDPLWIHVRVTPADDAAREIESALMENAPSHGISVTERSKFPQRIASGIWYYEINPDLYEVNKTYTVHWRVSMQPSVMNVLRTNFTWRPIPEKPRDAENCVVYGSAQHQSGYPLPNVRVCAERYNDPLSLTVCESRLFSATDAFGYWWFELPRGSIQRFILGDFVRTIVVPDRDCVAFKDADEFDEELGYPIDPFGYPYPDIPGKPLYAPRTRPRKATREPLVEVTHVRESRQPLYYVHHQNAPSDVWLIEHPLPRTPVVSVFDMRGEEVIGDIEYVSDHVVKITFNAPVAGIARLVA